nr:hypothetical protein JVH1_6718 [Rhodococcus sp. JVH1]
MRSQARAKLRERLHDDTRGSGDEMVEFATPCDLLVAALPSVTSTLDHFSSSEPVRPE